MIGFVGRLRGGDNFEREIIGDRNVDRIGVEISVDAD